MILGCDEIRKKIEGIKLIEGFSDDCLESAGYDLRVGRFHVIESPGAFRKTGRKMAQVTQNTEDSVTLRKGDYLLVESLEKVNMPSDLCAFILPKSSLFRMGGSLKTALVDPGFQGTLTMGLAYHAGYELTVEKGVKLAQIVFKEVKGEVKPYDGKFQGGKIN